MEPNVPGSDPAQYPFFFSSCLSAFLFCFVCLFDLLLIVVVVF